MQLNQPFFHIIQAATSFKLIIIARDSVSVDSEAWDKLNDIAESIIPENMTVVETRVFNMCINN